MKELIIDKIKRNRISTTEIADCMGKKGNIPSVHSLNRLHFKVGEVRWIYAYDSSNWTIHEQIREVKENEIVLVETFNYEDRAVFGHLVSKYLILCRQTEAIVVMGKLRDVPQLIKENWPIWFEGATPIGAFNKKPDKEINSSIIEKQRELYDGAIAVCDDSGVVVIPKAIQTEEFLNKLDWIEEQEDTWYDCIDRRKWDTFDTVCLKKYLNE